MQRRHSRLSNDDEAAPSIAPVSISARPGSSGTCGLPIAGDCAMYKHQLSRQHHEERQGLCDVNPEERVVPLPKPNTSRRSSDPITIFSARDSDKSANVASRGILPGHVGGVFTGNVDDTLSQQPNGGNDQRIDGRCEEQMTETGTMTSLGNALEEVLESVDVATELHDRRRSNSRIQDWLGQQIEISSGSKHDRESEVQDQRNKERAEHIIKKLLGVDKGILDHLFRRAALNRAGPLSARTLELKVLERWAELSRRDTESLLRRAVGSSPSATRRTGDAVRNPEISTRDEDLENIPWGVPEEHAKDSTNWNEDFTLTLIFNYLKSQFARTQTDDKVSARVPEEQLERAHKHARTAQPALSPTSLAGSTMTDRTASGTTTCTSTARKLPSLPHETSTRVSSHLRQARHDRNRSRTSRSSSFHTVSLKTGSCSVASIRRSQLGSNFWDLRSLGGASATSRDLGGNWSIYA